MTDRSDDRPLSSEEMIKRARADLDQRPSLPEMGIDHSQIRDQVEEEMPSVDELVAAPRPSNRPSAVRPRTPRRRMTRAERRPPAGFGDARRSGAGNAIAVAVAMALVVLGAAVFLVLAATGNG
jgi:hypothetical protein